MHAHSCHWIPHALVLGGMILLCMSEPKPLAMSSVLKQCGVMEAAWSWGYWLPDMRVPCFTGWHLKISLAMGTPLLVLVCLGIPLLPLLLLFKSRKALHTAPVRSQLGFIYSPYRLAHMHTHIHTRIASKLSAFLSCASFVYLMLPCLSLRNWVVATKCPAGVSVLTRASCTGSFMHLA